MGAEAMFNLDRAIAEWRTAFERDAAFARHEIDELEEHLRDSVAERIAAGERLSEAFDAARVAVGMPTVLRDDYWCASEWRSGWPSRLRVVGSAGFALYTAFFLGYVLITALGGLEVGWQRYTDGPWAPVIAMVFVMLNIGVYLGFAGLMLYRGRTFIKRAGTVLSVASLGLAGHILVHEHTWFNVASSVWIWDPASATGVLGWLTFLPATNGLTLLGLVALGIWNRERTWARRSLLAFGGALSFVQAQWLWSTWAQSTTYGFTGMQSPLVVMLLTTVAYVLIAALAWNQWGRAPRTNAQVA
ncbi:MAG: hypothetical protein RhofKO_26980 [Rhodothermales bacterium]